MIYVYAAVKTKPGMLLKALESYRALVPQIVANEPGCLEYVPTVDTDLGLQNQEKDPDRILVAERWKTVEDFRAHLKMPHCLAFRAAIAPYLAGRITIKITQGLPDLIDEANR